TARSVAVGRRERREHDRVRVPVSSAVRRRQLISRDFYGATARACESLRSILGRVDGHPPQRALVEVETRAQGLEQLVQRIGKRGSRCSRCQSLGERSNQKQKFTT